jgi:tRNA (guanosine-2'-O-)-methyltransferase
MLLQAQDLSVNERKELIKFLREFKLNDRLVIMDKVLKARTRYFTVLLENICHPHNASAVIRSCECFGIQDVHLIDDDGDYSVNKYVVKGASKWMDINKYSGYSNNSEEAILRLKSKGYRIVATKPGNAETLETFDVKAGPAAFVFGTELTGISPTVMSMADEFITIPTVGFTESLNLSVSVAVIMQSLLTRLYSTDVKWQLPDIDKDIIELHWLRKTIPKVALIEKHFFNNLEK